MLPFHLYILIISQKNSSLKRRHKKGTGYFFCMSCPRAETFLSLPGKVACPLFSALKKRVAPIHFYPKSKPDPYIVNNLNYSRVEIAADARRGP